MTAQGLALATQDTTTMLGRELRHTLRYPLMLVASIISPVVMLLLFDYVLGGPLGRGLGPAGHGVPYIDYLVPGLLVMTVASATSTTAINVCTDMTGGIIDRFRTMAISRSALLAGHVGANVLRTVVNTVFMIAVALAAGFRPHATAGGWLAIAGVLVAFGFALAWLSVALGLITRSVAGANSSTLPLAFLLPFLSSAFVPPASMPPGLRWFAAHQPFTTVANCLRALLAGTPAGHTGWVALTWCAAVAAGGYLWARSAFRRHTR
jgi:ABC-2 type transport system permease protein